MGIIDLSRILNYGDIALLVAGAGALLFVLYYYRIIYRLQKSILPEEKNWLLPFSMFLLFLSYVLFIYRLISGEGIFQSSFLSSQDTFASIVFFAATIFVLYATQELKNTFLKVNREFAAIFENISVGIHTVNTLGIVDFASPSFLKICSVEDSRDVIGKHISDIPFYRGNDAEVAIRNVLRQKKSFSAEISPVSGGAKWYHISATSMGDGRDILERVLVLVEDVTEQRLLDRAKSDFVSIASHEMRTPLTIIRGNASMLREDLVAGAGSNPDAVSMVSSIEGSSIRLMKIVNDFLDVIRLEGGQAKLSLQKEPFDFNSIVQGVVADLQAAATKKNISLTFHAPESPLPLAMGDKERAEQVAINLVMNAIQYTDHGGVDVSVKKDGGSIMLTVKDTGIGIAEAFQKNLFQKFGTAGRSFAHSKEYGSGLGLYICKLLADAMAGHLQLEKSAPGAGSTFSFSLPLATPAV